MTTRRRFFALAAIAIGSTVGLIVRGFARLRSTADVARDLARLAGDPASARVLGLIYLDSAAGRADAEYLDEIVVGNLSGARAADPQRLRELVGARIRRDWADGDTVRLDGWVLARTEVRLCALVALGAGEGTNDGE